MHFPWVNQPFPGKGGLLESSKKQTISVARVQHRTIEGITRLLPQKTKAREEAKGRGGRGPGADPTRERKRERERERKKKKWCGKTCACHEDALHSKTRAHTHTHIYIYTHTHKKKTATKPGWSPEPKHKKTGTIARSTRSKNNLVFLGKKRQTQIQKSKQNNSKTHR